MNIPLFESGRQYESVRTEIEQAVLGCMRSQDFIEGEPVKSFEKHIADYLGVKHAVTVNSGTDALIIALKCCGIGPGDEVITTSFSFFASAEAIAAVGAVPVFADIFEDNYTIDPASAERLITPRTRAILPVHIFGAPCDMDVIIKIASAHGLKVIEDACQAIGSSIGGKKTGSLGDIAAFSFFPTKNLGAYGDGGLITTDDDSPAVIAEALKNHGLGRAGFDAARALGREPDCPEDGRYTKYFYIAGGNSRLDSIQAAVLDVKLGRLDEWNARRDEIADKYRKGLSGLPVSLPSPSSEVYRNVWHMYVIRTDKKQELVNFLHEHGVQASTLYSVPLHLQKAFTDLGYKSGDLPAVEKVCSQTVCLPAWPELTDEETDYIIKTIREFFEG